MNEIILEDKLWVEHYIFINEFNGVVVYLSTLYKLDWKWEVSNCYSIISIMYTDTHGSVYYLDS